MIRGAHILQKRGYHPKILGDSWAIRSEFDAGVAQIQSDTKKRELLKCVVAAMYSWQHCGTGTLSYRQPRHLVITNQLNGQQRAFAIKMFQFLLGFFKSSRFFFVSPCITRRGTKFSSLGDPAPGICSPVNDDDGSVLVL